MQQASTSRPRSVFVSYSRADLAQVRALAAALRRCGIATWLDLDDLLPGQRWKEAIANALGAADAMIFCMSPLSLDSAWTGVELAKARALGVPIIPVAMDTIDWHALPDALRELHGHDMTRHPPKRAAEATARDIAMALGVDPPPTSDSRNGEATIDLIAVVMDAVPLTSAELAALRESGIVDSLDFSRPALIRLADLVHWASHARRATLVIAPSTDPALCGLVLGTLAQAFGGQRLNVLVRGDANATIVDMVGLAAVPLRSV